MGEKRNVYRLLVGKPEGKRPLGRPRRRWIDNIKMINIKIKRWINRSAHKATQTVEDILQPMYTT
jgi:hypothetical protein